MIQSKSFTVLLFLLFCFLSIFPQKGKIDLTRTAKNNLVYDNVVYSTYIKSVQIRISENEKAFPIIDLDKKENFSVSFDDLRADNRSIYYSIELCNADWTPSRLQSIDYLSGYDEDRIYTLKHAQNTIQPYTHYAFSFPNENIKPKIAGNYLLKVYDEANKSRLLFSRKIYIIKSKINPFIEVIPSLESAKRTSNQKLNVTFTNSINIENPNQTLQIHVFQNQRNDNLKILKQPSQITADKIFYNNANTLDFSSNNEFRKLDLRSVRSPSTTVKSIKRDSTLYAEVETDKILTNEKYIYSVDENGQFFVRNTDFHQSDTQSEYIHVHFSVEDTVNLKGDIYLVGAFNNYSTNLENKLTYNTNLKIWETTQLLKQGLYDYEYVLRDKNQLLTDYFSGSFYETENDYQVIIYYRKPGTYWDEIVGFKQINNTK